MDYYRWDREVIVDGHSRNVRRGDVVYLTAGQRHALRALNDVHLIEVRLAGRWKG